MDINKIIIFIFSVIYFLYLRKEFILKYNESEFLKALNICCLSFFYIEGIHSFSEIIVEFLNLVLK